MIIMRHHLSHLFSPQLSNNQRARILHPAGLSVLIGIYLVVYLISQFISVKGGTKDYVLGYASAIDRDEIVIYTNDQRILAGLPPLTMNEQLSQAAQEKANDMFANNYWAHISPTGTTPWVFIKNTGYEYSVAGENLARDFNNSLDVVNAWMNSDTHKANIVHNKYTQIGVAVVNGRLDGVETTLVVQMFGLPLVNSPAISSGITDSSEFIAMIDQADNAQTPSALASPAPSRAYYSANVAGQTIISPHLITKTVGIAIILLILMALIYDHYHSSRRNIARLVGKNLAHLGFFGLILLVIILIKEGSVL